MPRCHSTHVSVDTAQSHRVPSSRHCIPCCFQLIKDSLRHTRCENRTTNSLSNATQGFTSGTANDWIRICYRTLARKQKIVSEPNKFLLEIIVITLELMPFFPLCTFLSFMYVIRTCTVVKLQTPTF